MTLVIVRTAVALIAFGIVNAAMAQSSTQRKQQDPQIAEERRQRRLEEQRRRQAEERQKRGREDSRGTQRVWLDETKRIYYMAACPGITDKLKPGMLTVAKMRGYDRALCAGERPPQ